jgi:hypothetical protein
VLCSTKLKKYFVFQSKCAKKIYSRAEASLAPVINNWLAAVKQSKPASYLLAMAGESQ